MLNLERSDTPNRLTKEAYTVSEVAKLLEPPVNPITIYRQIYAGNIKVLDGFGRIRIPRSELERFFNRVSVYTPKKRCIIQRTAEDSVQ
jgi:helix-turn-helix protein